MAESARLPKRLHTDPTPPPGIVLNLLDKPRTLATLSPARATISFSSTTVSNTQNRQQESPPHNHHHLLSFPFDGSGVDACPSWQWRAGERMRAVPGVLESANGGSGLAHVPKRYVVPSSHRPNPSQETANVPVIDLRELKESPAQRSTAVEAIGHACRRFGIFHVVNHGICQSVLEEAISAASSFFNLPMEEKVKFMSGDAHKPVRYGTGFNFKEGVDRTQYWRLFLKHYAHPLQDWIGSWPENPPAYREKMGKYCAQVRRVAMELTEAITESLGIGSAYLTPGMSHGMQVMAVNCYPPCPNPDLALGLPAHSDYGCLTVLLQSLPGLQIMDAEDGGAWKLVPKIDGALQVHVGDHIEVLSNGLYKSLVHRAILNSERTRISIASLHSLGMDEKMGTAKELVSEHHPMGYHESSFRDFLNFLPASDFAEGKSFIRTLRTEK